MRTQPIIPRKPRLPFGKDIPKHWVRGSAVLTHLSNGVNLLFPAGERFFVRSVRHYLDRYDADPVMQTQIRGFFGQEGRHAQAHERFFQVLEDQGYEIRPFLDRFEAVNFKLLEKWSSPVLRLSATAAAEHFTAVMAEHALRDGLAGHHPTMRALFLWHAAEEIEHKAVAFEVLQAVDDRYWVRAVGMYAAAIVLSLWWAAGARMLLAQDGITVRDALRQLKTARAAAGMPDHSIVRNVFLAGIRDYLRRDFHPNDKDNYHLAEAYLAEAYLAEAA